MRELDLVSTSADETRAIAASIAGALEPGDVVVLSGDLGAGKTCFVQGAAAALGVAGRVTSPSFVLVREYRGRARIVHADVYRLGSLQELFDLGYEELFDAGAITFVEWGDTVSDALPVERLEVEIRRDQRDERRHLAVRAVGAGWERRFPVVHTPAGRA